MSEFKLLMPHEVITRWDDLSVLLADALAEGGGECAPDDIRSMVLAGRMFVFADDQFAATVEFVTYPRKTVMILGFGAGKIRDLKVVDQVVRDFGRQAGASSIQTYCKNPAMVRYHRRFNFEPVYAVLETTL